MVTEPTRLGILFWVGLGVATSSLSMLWLAAFLSDYPLLSTTVSGTQLVSTAHALSINLGLLAIFGLQHSVMPRPFVKERIERLMHPASGRGLYNVASGIAIIAMVYFWQPVEGHIWQIGGVVAWMIWAVFGIGVAMAGLAVLVIGGGELLGLPQAKAALSGDDPFKDTFRTPWLYKVVRHPMQLGIVLMLWATPDMSFGRLIFAAGMTAYIWIGVTLEERSLVAAYGETYRQYQKEVPKLLPWPRD